MEAAFPRAEEKERREIKEADEHREPNPWLRCVGWAAHLAGLDRGEVREWVEMPYSRGVSTQLHRKWYYDLIISRLCAVLVVCA